MSSGFGTSLKTTGIAEDYTTAAFFAKDVLAELELRKEPKVGRENGDFGESFPNYSWTTEVERGATLPFYRAMVQIFFVRGNAEREIVLRTILLANGKDGINTAEK